jgi:hypothetical protein
MSSTASAWLSVLGSIMRDAADALNPWSPEGAMRIVSLLGRPSRPDLSSGRSGIVGHVERSGRQVADSDVDSLPPRVDDEDQRACR